VKYAKCIRVEKKIQWKFKEMGIHYDVEHPDLNGEGKELLKESLIKESSGGVFKATLNQLKHSQFIQIFVLIIVQTPRMNGLHIRMQSSIKSLPFDFEVQYLLFMFS